MCDLWGSGAFKRASCITHMTHHFFGFVVSCADAWQAMTLTVWRSCFYCGPCAWAVGLFSRHFLANQIRDTRSRSRGRWVGTHVMFLTTYLASRGTDGEWGTHDKMNSSYTNFNSFIYTLNKIIYLHNIIIHTLNKIIYLHNRLLRK